MNIELAMRRICVCGGAISHRANRVFCEELGKRIARDPDLGPLTGGFKNHRGSGDVSADWSTATVVEKTVREMGDDVRTERVLGYRPDNLRDFRKRLSTRLGHLVK